MGNFLLKEVPTLEQMAKRSRDGRMRIPFDAIWGGALEPGATPLGAGFTELNHRRWRSTRSAVGEMQACRVVSEMAMTEQIEQ
jgi:hypothetical protein